MFSSMNWMTSFSFQVIETLQIFFKIDLDKFYIDYSLLMWIAGQTLPLSIQDMRIWRAMESILLERTARKIFAVYSVPDSDE